MTYDEAIAFWYGRINYEVRSAAPKDLKLERMRALLNLLGDPHDRLRILHVTGTKGKGSTCAMLASCLQAAGFRVGLFTSPHLQKVEERLQVNQEPISGAELAVLMAEVATVVKRLDDGPWPPPTFFEISTALGFLHFVRRRCEIVVLEVGLGGRFDSTNVCHPLATVITSIGLDHMAQLGNTLEAIAYQKAGIIKRGIPLISGVTQPGPREVIRHVAKELHAPKQELRIDFQFSYQALPTPSVTVSSGCHFASYSLKLLGAHQAANAAIAVTTLRALQHLGLPIPESAISHGLENVRWPARIEWVSRSPNVILDTAHNVPSVEALIQTIQESFANTRTKKLIFAVSSDKQYAEMLAMLGQHFDEFYLTKYGNNPRCVAPEKLLHILAQTAPARAAHVFLDASSAWEAALKSSQPDDLICISGSVFLAGELEQVVRATSSQV